MRERALSAVVLVPPLVVALIIGGWAILLVVTVAAVLGAWEVFRLLRYAGYPSLPWLARRMEPSISYVFPVLDRSRR